VAYVASRTHDSQILRLVGPIRDLPEMLFNMVNTSISSPENAIAETTCLVEEVHHPEFAIGIIQDEFGYHMWTWETVPN
jgi:hypothetical protein